MLKRRSAQHHAPRTLGEALDQRTKGGAGPNRAVRALLALYLVLHVLILTTLTVTAILCAVWWPDIPGKAGYVLLGGAVAWGVVAHRRRAVRRRMVRHGGAAQGGQHPLLAHDAQGFMADLALEQKTVVFDGSNIYHFGLQENLGPRPLKAIAAQLRDEGYRVVCFFDANIHYTLIKYGDAPTGKPHEMKTLLECFGLTEDEIYVVPTRMQADRYVLDSLRHLPRAFAVSNDQFRDYAKRYPDVMTDDQWRKGVMVTDTEIRVRKHKFATPVPLQDPELAQQKRPLEWSDLFKS